jgi:rhamnosyltransferase
MTVVKMRKENICAIIVTYNPDIDFPKRVAGIARQANHVLIVDNNSSEVSKRYLAKLGNLPNVCIIYNQANLGIAAALNIGVKYALQAGYDWVATFDQDSTATPPMIASMLKAYGTFPEKEKLALIAPRYRAQATGLFTTFSPNAKNAMCKLYAPILRTMTSGNLIRTNIFASIGYFNEAMFIDYVDNEFCLRCIKGGLVIIEVQKAILVHNLGQITQHKFLWRKCAVTNHNYIRRYYITRNRIYLYKKYFTTFPKWVLVDLRAFILETIKLLLFENDRKMKISSIIRGVYHGLAGKLGKK